MVLSDRKKACLALLGTLPLPLILLVACHISVHAGTEDRSGEIQGRYFTVRDSIEMVRFGRLDYEPQFSPDGKYFVVVTSRGIIESNEIESTLRIFAVAQVRECLHNDKATIPSPEIVAKLAATPTRPRIDSYGPIISDVRWAADSKGLLFLAENSLGNRRLYLADVEAGAAKALTPPDEDVSQFDSAGGTIAYRVTEFKSNSEDAYSINTAARSVTGMEIQSILFPDDRMPASYSRLWVNLHGRNSPVVNATTGHPFRLWNEPADWSPFSVSPNGKSVVALVPVKGIPESWEHYEPKYPTATPRIHARDPNFTSDSNPSRITQYALIDLTTGQAEPLVNAPNGWALSYNDRNRATWSSDGKKLLLVNTFLPLTGIDKFEKSRRVRPCAAAVVDLMSKAVRCVSYGHSEHVWGSFFGQSADEVVLHFGEQFPPERFRFHNDAWQLETPPAEKGPPLPRECAAPRHNLWEGLSLRVKQDLNSPPVLVAADCQTGRQKTIWDPNPKLAKMRLGEASIIRWKDSSEYEWKGVLVKPPDYVPGKRYPVVIHTYGFAEGEFVTDGLYTTAFAARPLAATDIVVLLGFELRPDHLLTAQEAQEQIVGYESAIERLVSDGLVDAEKIGIIGFSRTCYYVQSAIVQHPRRFAAATIADGVGEGYLQSLLNPGAEKEGEAIYGARPFGEGLKKWVDQAPAFNLHRVQTPLRIEAFGPVSLLWQWEVYASLWHQNKPVDLIYIPGGQHILQRPLDRMASQQGNVDWFRFWLKGEEDPDPAKFPQYKRWRQLRTTSVIRDDTSIISQQERVPHSE